MNDEIAGEVDGPEAGEGRDHRHDLEAHAGNVRHRREGVQGLHDAIGLDDLVGRRAPLGLAGSLPRRRLPELEGPRPRRELAVVVVELVLGDAERLALDAADPRRDAVGEGVLGGEGDPLVGNCRRRAAVHHDHVLVLAVGRGGGRRALLEGVGGVAAAVPFGRGRRGGGGARRPRPVQVPVAPEEEPPPQLPAARGKHLARRPLLQHHAVGGARRLHRRRAPLRRASRGDRRRLHRDAAVQEVPKVVVRARPRRHLRRRRRVARAGPLRLDVGARPLQPWRRLRSRRAGAAV
uniref:Uncharacterized protein n=1 Tax=Arundo donax TaxID=35708 RepID=A0A0A9EIK0_ARUDO